MRSALFEGRFGRMFRNLPPFLPADPALRKLAKQMVEPEPKPGTEDKSGDNPDIPAGFTYFGQFVDHDLTFDPISQLQRDNDPDALTDFRTPRLDLDSVYSRGPDDVPFIYDRDGVHLLIGRNAGGDDDLPRNSNGRALLGDSRNDENLIVSQLALGFLKYHNRVVDALAQTPADERFDEARRIVRWHFQWAVIHDFLVRLVGEEVIRDVLQPDAFTVPTDRGKKIVKTVKVVLKFFRWGRRPFMPVEFSVAAYRFGHSMVRGEYELNAEVQDVQIVRADDLKPLPPDLIKEFGQDTPLFFYVLKEAEVFSQGRKLGPVGGRIVAEVIIGLIRGDPSSFMSVQPMWQPKAGEFGALRDGEFSVADLLRFAKVRIT